MTGNNCIRKNSEKKAVLNKSLSQLKTSRPLKLGTQTQAGKGII